MRIYVGNLSWDLSEADLRAAFEAYGAVESVSLITDKFTGQSKGFAFVEMPGRSEAEAAIKGLNGKEMQGRALTVNEARPREERSGGGGGRGPGGGGPGGRRPREGGGRRFR